MGSETMQIPSGIPEHIEHGEGVASTIWEAQFGSPARQAFITFTARFGCIITIIVLCVAQCSTFEQIIRPETLVEDINQPIPTSN